MSVREELLAATDEAIEDAVTYADPMVLRGLLYQLTRDEELPAMEVERRMLAFLAIPSIKHEADVQRLRSKAVAWLKADRDRGAGEVELGDSRDHLFASLELTAGSEIPFSEREIWFEQTALDPWIRGVDWKAPPPAEQRAKFKVAIIGTGLSGLNAAVHLERAGIPYVVIEKNSEVGGTWFENRYPGARVDTQSRGYTHLFGAGFHYPYAYCPRDENMKYMRWVADSFGIRERIVFNTEVKSAIWDEASQMWDLCAVGPDGERNWRVNAVISCVGFLSRPQLPSIPGMESFQGVACHTAQWPDGLDVAGKRVAVIGSGASGYQTTPVIAETAAHTYLFQRSPNWLYEDPNYLKLLPEQITWLERNLPFYVNFARFRQSTLTGPVTSKIATQIDPDYVDPHARSAANKLVREGCIEFLNRKLPGRPDLVAKMTPEAPPMSSRPIRVGTDGNVLDALMRDNVTLVSDPIERITPTGVQVGGEEIPLDIILYATGFKANDFLWPMEIVGRNGARIEELWAKDGPRAYIGAMLPGFPNFFMSYGPNTNNFGGFQVVDLLEIVTRFALQCIGGLIVQGKHAVDVKTDAYWRFNEELDLEEKTMLYMDPRAHSYYQNEHGRSCVNGPVDIRRMWRWLRDPAGTPSKETDGGLRPYFGEDLIVT